MSNKSKAIIFSILSILLYAATLISIVGFFSNNVAYGLFSLFLIAIPNWVYAKARKYANNSNSKKVQFFTKYITMVIVVIVVFLFLLMLPTIIKSIN